MAVNDRSPTINLTNTLMKLSTTLNATEARSKLYALIDETADTQPGHVE